MQGTSYIGDGRDENQTKNTEDPEIDNSKNVHHH